MIAALASLVPRIFVDVVHWIFDASHRAGPDGIVHRITQHVEISVASILVAAAIALPAGLYVGHKRRGQVLAVTVANVGRAVPSFAVLVMVFAVMVSYAPRFAFGNGPGLVALALLAIPPILTNTYVGIQSVDPDTVEAARAIGMRERQVLFELEVPLTAAVIMGGVRTSSVQVVASASLIALIGGGGLGRYIIDGFARGDTVMAVSGAVLIALLALVTEILLALVQRLVSPAVRES